MSNKKLKLSEVAFEYTGIEETRDVPIDVTIVRFHSSVTEVGVGVFRACQQLKKVVLNEGLKKIGKESFYYCCQLEHINFPSTLIEVGVSAFCGCNLKDVVLNEGLQTIGEAAFASCYSSLESITIPHTVTEISERTFYNCQNLREVVLNEGLQTIGLMAFGHCSLERITIPHTVRVISENTFWNCTSLREIELHGGIEKIGPDAFERCINLERFTFHSLSTRLESIIEDGKYEDVVNKIDDIRDIVERRGSEMFISDKRLVQGRNWDTLRSVLCRIDRVITYYEVKEATTLLELAMWKSKIDQADENFINIKRDACRIDIPGPVKDTIMQYLNFRV